jgi:hypothetical protein
MITVKSIIIIETLLIIRQYSFISQIRAILILLKELPSKPYLSFSFSFSFSCSLPIYISLSHSVSLSFSFFEFGRTR